MKYYLSFLLLAIVLPIQSAHSVEPNGGMKTNLNVFIEAPGSTNKMLTKDQVRNLVEKYPGEAATCIQRIQGLFDTLGSESGDSEIGLLTGEVTLKIDSPASVSISTIVNKFDIERNGQGISSDVYRVTSDCDESTKRLYIEMEFVKEIYKERYGNLDARQKVFDDFISTLNSGDEGLVGRSGRTTKTNTSVGVVKGWGADTKPQVEHNKTNDVRIREAQ